MPYDQHSEFGQSLHLEFIPVSPVPGLMLLNLNLSPKAQLTFLDLNAIVKAFLIFATGPAGGGELCT